MIVLTNCLTLVGDYNFTCSTNQVALEMKAAELDATTFCSNGWETKLGGLRSATVKHSGFADYGVTDAAVPSNVGVNDTVIREARMLHRRRTKATKLGFPAV
jgi:hypothetical protein